MAVTVRHTSLRDGAFALISLESTVAFALRRPGQGAPPMSTAESRVLANISGRIVDGAMGSSEAGVALAVRSRRFDAFRTCAVDATAARGEGFRTIVSLETKITLTSPFNTDAMSTASGRAGLVNSATIGSLEASVALAHKGILLTHALAVSFAVVQ